MVEKPIIQQALIDNGVQRYKYITARQKQDLDKLIDYIMSFNKDD